MKQNFLDLPELVDHLVPYLSPADLLSCVQLNSTWNKNFIPFLWRSIDDTVYSWDIILCQIRNPHPQPQPPAVTTTHTAEGATETAPDNIPFSTCCIHKSRLRDSDYNKNQAWLFGIFEKYGHHIREIKIRSPLVLEAAGRKETCTGLLTLVLELDAYKNAPRSKDLPRAKNLPRPPATSQPHHLAILAGLDTLAIPPVVCGLAAVPLFTVNVVGDSGAAPAPAFGGFDASSAAASATASLGEIGPLSALAPALAVGGFGVVPTAAAAAVIGGGFGVTAPVTPAVIFGEFGPTAAVAPAVAPAVAFGGFGVASAAVTVHGFGATPVDQRANPYQESDVGLSEPLFPDHLTLADFKARSLSELTPESNKARMEYFWTLTQHIWHLIRINPGLVLLDISRSTFNGQICISPDFTFATLRLLKHLKNFNGNDDLLESLNFWKLWDALPARIESLSIRGQLLPTRVFPLPDPLPKVNTSLKVLLAEGSTTVNGLLTLLGIFPNLTRLLLQNIDENPRYMSSPNYTPLPPAPFGGQHLKKLQANVQDWDTVLHYISGISEWEATREPLNEDLALFLKDRRPNLVSFAHTWKNWYINEQLVRGIRGNDPTNQFLITHRHLRKFDSIENFIKVDEMLREPWTCMGLEWLTCRIVGIDRLTLQEEEVATRVMAPEYSTELSAEEIVMVEKFNRCRAQHHGVYDRLASLTRLKHLDLGYENRYPQYESLEGYPTTFDTLELTLESGLDRLGALKNLEMFGFECIDHKIGKAELEWMAKGWPNLNLMYGLQPYDVELDRNRAALGECFKTLRPDVLLDSGFTVDY
ncbi:hypothetical protein BGZ96_009277 [Linnemannia gamsii]|uniref:F-box domain-containing protein n=1 Tax=Linnemannia gamsii TaxID=64522 RepID=A0ABQ7JWJ9_9FUNG|nr:hypothetical protein BGZ96_009277 [Linnemannia gamsii]